MIDLCLHCKEICKKNQNLICCDLCNCWCHLKCSFLTLKQFRKLSNSNDLYFCNYCINDALPFSNIDCKTFNEQFGNNNSAQHEVLKFNNTLLQEQNEDYFTHNQLQKFFVDVTNQFSLFHFNTRSLGKNKASIEELLNTIEHAPDILAISETKITQNSTYNLSIPGYFMLHKDSGSRSGGVAIYLNRNLKYVERVDLSIDVPNCENLWLEILLNNMTRLVIGVIYRHPDKNFSIFKTKLIANLNNLNNCKTQYIICGDINIDLLKATKQSSIADYKECLDAAGTQSVISSATRYCGNDNPSLLDHIYTNISSNKTKSGICLHDTSDHLPVFMCIKKNLKTANFSSKLTRKMKNFNTDYFLCDLQIALNETHIHTDNANDSMNSFISTFQMTLDKHAPLTEMSRTEKKLSNKPWITKGIYKSIKTKNKLFKMWINTKKNSVKSQYKTYCNKLNHLKRSLKHDYFQKQFEENKYNSRKTWAIINELIDGKSNKNCKKIPPTILLNEKTYQTDSSSFINLLNNYFTNVGTSMASAIPTSNVSFKNFLSNRVSSSFVFQEISETEVYDVIKNLKTNKASGIFEISNKFIKMAALIICPIFTKLLNKCFENETFPDVFKISQIIPIPKVNVPQHLQDFRPISLLPTFAKIFEKIIHNKMMSFIDKFKIIDTAQHGFQERDSTNLALATIYEKLLSNLNDNKFTCSVFLDLSKAFDTVNHDILIKKIQHYGFRGKFLNVLKSYLSNRIQCTKINNRSSDFTTVKCGVPQGSILGPLLFLLYINDLPNATNMKTTLFADDSNFLMAEKCLMSLQNKVNKEICGIDLWMKSNKLSINYSKTVYMLFSNKKKAIQQLKVTINGHCIERKSNFKYLGVTLDECLS